MKMEKKLELLRNGDIFEDLIHAWKRLGRLVYNDTATDPQSLERATGLLYMTRYLAAGATLAMELNDPEYPYFDRWADRSYSWGIDSPDGLYSLPALVEIRHIVFSEIAVQHTNLILRFILHISQTPQIIKELGI